MTGSTILHTRKTGQLNDGKYQTSHQEDWPTEQREVVPLHCKAFCTKTRPPCAIQDTCHKRLDLVHTSDQVHLRL
jgi:hypothetical protein